MSTMEDSIINIDDCDSFSLSSDTDIRNIVDQWKRKDAFTNESKDLKHVDTRTFTRPKKRLFSSSELNGGLFNRRNNEDIIEQEQATTSSNAMTPKIDLKIGGLVTSMQRSFLGDVSPPANMDSSFEPMGNSLITSSDFSNVNEFINGNEDSLSMAQFNQYRLTDAINDRNFLERLTNYDDSLFTKDADINNIDENHLIDNGNGSFSGNSTLQNSTDSSGNLDKNDETFAAENGKINGTFNADGEIDKTFIQAMDEPIKNETFNYSSNHDRTFETKPNEKEKTWNKTVDILDDEELSLCGSFNINDFKKPGTPEIENSAPLKASEDKSSEKIFLDGLESTPARRNSKKSRQSTTLENISPILLEQQHSTNQQNVDKFIDIEIEDEFPVILRDSTPKCTTRSSNISGFDRELRDKERRSLANFEEFENKLLILENIKNEDEFDDLLDSFSANIRNPLSEKVQQSLDTIKKRHTSMGIEKQQQDELNCEKINTTPKIGKFTNDLNSRSPVLLSSSSSSSGSATGERLLRRSRLFDDFMNISEGIEPNLNATTTLNGDNRQTIENNTTELLNQKNLPHLDGKSHRKTDNDIVYNTENMEIEGKSLKNRDRFKTMRIFKKPPDNAVQIPDAEETFVQHTSPARRSIDAFASKNINSPKLPTHTDMKNEQLTPSQKTINTMTFKRTALARPRQLLGALQKRDMYTKSSSQEILSNDDQNLEATFTQPKKVSQLKSPMGIKSKSIHNLSSNAQRPYSERSSVAVGKPSTSSNTFKVPQARSLATMRQKPSVAPQRLTLVRPSSGYYGYNTRRTDSDTESGRFSSTNSLSSGSSKSSLSRGETPESQFQASIENPNATFVQPPNVPSRSMTATGMKAPQSKLSLLRPPTQIRRSALPRPTITSTKR